MNSIAPSYRSLARCRCARACSSVGGESALCLAFHDIGSEVELIGASPNTLRVTIYLIIFRCRRGCVGANAKGKPKKVELMSCFSCRC
jgi:hypothetical protein